jgi:hypothetical protein
MSKKLCETLAEPYGVSTRGRVPNPAAVVLSSSQVAKRNPSRKIGASAGGGPFKLWMRTSPLSTLRGADASAALAGGAAPGLPRRIGGACSAVAAV